MDVRFYVEFIRKGSQSLFLQRRKQVQRVYKSIIFLCKIFVLNSVNCSKILLNREIDGPYL